MKKVFSILIAMMLLGVTFAQENDTTYWKKGAVGTIGFTNTGYSTFWQAGALPSQSILVNFNANAYYTKDKISWQNDLALAYGLLRQGEADNTPFLKNADRIEFTSKLGYKLAKKLLLSTQLNFRSQFAPGYEFDPAFPTNVDSANLISRFLSPAYLNLGVGLDYQYDEHLSIYYAPLNAKVTIVSDENLRALYIPQDITTGPTRFELGSNLTVKYNREVFENVQFKTVANFFANYLQNFGNVDVNWETLTTAKVNSWLAINFATNLIYDDDIKFVIERDEEGNATKTGPRTQFQHILSVGLTYTFIE
ncbi:MAG: DUF3078 domain-containing protein [Bacteroidia bacterium]|nr:DUF3078 domain-containing protein [Bacteroidia bacterium]